MWDSLAGFIDACKDKIYGTEVERAIEEEVSIAKAEVKLATLTRDIEKAAGKITNAKLKKSYTDAVKRIRSKVR